MASRIIMTPWAAAVLVTIAAAQQPANPTAASAPTGLAKNTPEAQPEAQAGSVDEAVQSSRDAYVRLETVTNAAVRQELLDSIQANIEIIRRQAPNHPWLPYLTGRAFMLIGRRGDAAERLLKFVETREGRNEWRAHRSLGDLFIDEFPRLAQTHYERAAALKPNDPNILLGQSVCAARLGRSDEAIQLARAATTADGGTSVKFVAHLSGILRAAGEWADALEYARRALRLATEAAGTRSGDEAALRTADAQYQALIETLQGAIAAEDTPANQSYMDLAEALRRRFDVQQKLNLLNVLRVMETAVAETAPNSPPFLLEHHAVTLAELGRTDQAVEAFERLRNVDPNNPLIAEWMLRLKTHSPPGSPGE